MLALLFPGQGSQQVGMGRDVVASSEAARRTFEVADAALGFELSRICFEGPASELQRTELQQPAILTVSVALLRALEEQVDLVPDFVAGHSLGEYSALVANGALDFEDAVRLVHARGRFMQEAVPEGHGAMAAVLGLDPDAVAEACRGVAQQTGEVVAPANLNGAGQTVIAGTAAAVDAACGQAREAGARKTLPLSVSAPFHCALMEPAARKLELELGRVRFAAPRCPLVANVDAQVHGEAGDFAGLLTAQVTSPVRFAEMVAVLAAAGVDRVLEIGPGKVLTGLVRRIESGLARAHLESVTELSGAVEFVIRGGEG